MVVDIGNELLDRPAPNPERLETFYQYERVDAFKHLPQPSNPFFQDLETWDGSDACESEDDSHDSNMAGEGEGRFADYDMFGDKSISMEVCVGDDRSMFSEESAFGDESAQTGD